MQNYKRENETRSGVLPLYVVRSCGEDEYAIIDRDKGKQKINCKQAQAYHSQRSGAVREARLKCHILGKDTQGGGEHADRCQQETCFLIHKPYQLLTVDKGS